MATPSESHPRHHGFGGGGARSGLEGRAGAAATRVVSRRNSSGTTWPASVHDAGRPSARDRRRARRRRGAASALILHLNAAHGFFLVPLRGSIFWQQSVAFDS